MCSPFALYEPRFSAYVSIHIVGRKRHNKPTMAPFMWGKNKNINITLKGNQIEKCTS